MPSPVRVPSSDSCNGSVTRDLSAALSVPFALQFFEAHDWWQKRARMPAAGTAVQERNGAARLDAAPLGPPRFDAQMVAIALPECNGETLRQRLFDLHAIEMPVTHPRWPPVRTCLGSGIQQQSRTGPANAGVAGAAASIGRCLTGGRHGLLIALLRGAVSTSRTSAHDNLPIFATLAP